MHQEIPYELCGSASKKKSTATVDSGASQGTEAWDGHSCLGIEEAYSDMSKKAFWTIIASKFGSWQSTFYRGQNHATATPAMAIVAPMTSPTYKLSFVKSI